MSWNPVLKSPITACQTFRITKPPDAVFMWVPLTQESPLTVKCKFGDHYANSEREKNAIWQWGANETQVVWSSERDLWKPLIIWLQETLSVMVIRASGNEVPFEVSFIYDWTYCKYCSYTSDRAKCGEGHKHIGALQLTGHNLCSSIAIGHWNGVRRSLLCTAIGQLWQNLHSQPGSDWSGHFATQPFLLVGASL